MILPEHFPALVARDGVCTAEKTAAAEVLYDGDDAVTVKVHYSGINYKDALALTGKGKILRTSPMVPGIDYAGEALNDGGGISAGQMVVLTGYGVGESYSGGYAAYARAKPEWLLPLPEGFSAEQAMICGTAGLTAALCVLALRDSCHVKDGGDVVVSGASGGVGSFAVCLLARLGYRVTAVSRPDAEPYLRALGMADLLTRQDMQEKARPLEKARWHGAVDCVGGELLARILAETHYGGVVAACGLAASHKLDTTVMPFILRGVRLAGIDSVMAPPALRRRAWQLLADELQPDDFAAIHAETIPLAAVAQKSEEILAGNQCGRILVTPEI